MPKLNGIYLRNRVLTSASLVGYGAAPEARLIPYGLSPVARFLDLSRFGAVTTRTMTPQPHEGHFTTRTDWRLREMPQLLRRYSRALRRIDGGWMNAFGWANIGLERYFDDYFRRTTAQNRIISVGGFDTAMFVEAVAIVSAQVARGEIAAVELNLSCHNVNIDFDRIVEDVLDGVVREARHPLILKLSPDSDYVAIAKMAAERRIAGLTVMNTVKGLRLDPATGEPFMANRYGGMSGRCIKPIALRVVSELREAGIRLPIIATGGLRTFDDAREFFWAGADAVSLGSECFLAHPPVAYAAAPLQAARLELLRRRIDRHRPLT